MQCLLLLQKLQLPNKQILKFTHHLHIWIGITIIRHFKKLWKFDRYFGDFTVISLHIIKFFNGVGNGSFSTFSGLNIRQLVWFPFSSGIFPFSSKYIYYSNCGAIFLWALLFVAESISPTFLVFVPIFQYQNFLIFQYFWYIFPDFSLIGNALPFFFKISLFSRKPWYPQ